MVCEAVAGRDIDPMKIKPILLGLALLGLAVSATAVEKKELEGRLSKLTAQFEALQQKADKRVPAEVLRKAQGIILLDRTKAGFIFAYQGGAGVALVKDPKSEKWSPAAFLKADEASLGFQIGGEQAFYVILLMDTNATSRLTNPQAEFGGEARGTAGDVSAGEGVRFSSHAQSVLIFSDRKGLYGGATIKGGAVSPDEAANRVYYGQPLTLKDILFDKKVKPTESASELARKVIQHSKDAKK